MTDRFITHATFSLERVYPAPPPPRVRRMG